MGAGLVLLVIWLSLAPLPPEVDLGPSDKLDHLAAYFVLMGWHVQLFAGRGRRLALAAGLVAMGIGLELLQGLTSYRSAEVVDAFANTVGVALGWLAAPPRGPRVLAWLEQRLGAGAAR
ncbi:MAG TPA: VanZ family protein [Burkholderiales bacterium]|nr:VanZ family protein [Burkholderiales bacterium]